MHRKDQLKERLALLWRANTELSIAEFSALVFAQLKERVCHYLRSRNLWLSEEDAEDCFNEAVVRIMERRGKQEIIDPQSYVWRSAANAANDIGRARKREANTQDSSIIEDEEECSDSIGKDSARHRKKPAPIPIEPDFARYLVEGIVEEVEADSEEVVRVVQTAISRLPIQQRRVVAHLLRLGFDYNASNAPEDLGMKAVTFRSNRMRAQKALKNVIPPILRERGIKLRWISDEDLTMFQTKNPIPAVDDNE